MILADTACINWERGSELVQQRDERFHYYSSSPCISLYKEQARGHDLWLDWIPAQGEEATLPPCVNSLCAPKHLWRGATAYSPCSHSARERIQKLDLLNLWPELSVPCFQVPRPHSLSPSLTLKKKRFTSPSSMNWGLGCLTLTGTFFMYPPKVWRHNSSNRNQEVLGGKWNASQSPDFFSTRLK